MTLKQALERALALLKSHNIQDASIEAELLLRHTLKISRARLYLDLNQEISPGLESTFWTLIERRSKGEPSAYITGHREFFGLDFYVDQRVLIPRPESELLVETALSLAEKYPVSVIADIGTGCGAIAISLALKMPDVRVYATDISASALEVARINCQQHGVLDRVILLQGDMLDALPEPVNLIIANLPYVKESELVMTRTSGFEPKLALDGGKDGFREVHRLCHQAGSKLRPQGSLLLEVGKGQAKKVAALLRVLFPIARIELARDLSGVERVVSLSLTQSEFTAKLVD